MMDGMTIEEMKQDLIDDGYDTELRSLIKELNTEKDYEIARVEKAHQDRLRIELRRLWAKTHADA